ncbi:MAG: glycosyltransferase family 2 protein [Helicobacter sp.]|nr:glycosyltransferase family 2 protein [Helicobacter sp.]
MQIKFFIIIPIYNVESYLPKCLDSISNQTYPHFEAILINDGSTDFSEKIAQEYANKDQRFILFSQENQGLSLARNRGLEAVKDKITNFDSTNKDKFYICFVDSDDYWEKDALEIFSQIVFSNTDKNIEIIMTDSIFKIQSQSKILIKHYFLKNEQILENTVAPTLLIEYLKDNLHSVPQFVFQAKFLFKSKTAFIPHIIHKDNPFCLEIILKTKAIYINSKPYYNYTFNDNSITKQQMSLSYIKKKIYSYYTIIKYYDEILAYYDSPIIQNHIKSQITLLLQSLIRFLQIIGYSKDLKISKANLLPYARFLNYRKRFCLHFPYVYGLPKRIKQYLKSKFQTGKI